MTILLNIIWSLQCKRLQSVYRAIHRTSLVLMNYGIGIPSNWEAYTFKTIASYYQKKDTKPVLFDVGSHIGQTIQLWQKVFHTGHIHSFEPSTSNHQILKQIHISNKNIITIINHFWLSDIQQQATLYGANETLSNGSSSLYASNLTDFVSSNLTKEIITLETIDDYCAEKHINHIHFLKMDIEGNELKCLKGVKNMLQKGGIDFIQFEFNRCAIGARVFFHDFRELLHEQYDFYRELALHQWLSKIHKYDIFYEQFYDANYLLIKKGIQL